MTCLDDPDLSWTRKPLIGCSPAEGMDRRACPSCWRTPPDRPGRLNSPVRRRPWRSSAFALALAAGGVAVAAGTGVLPSPLRNDGVTPGRTSQSTAFVSASGTGQDTSVGPAAGGASPSAYLRGLCTAFLAHDGNAADKATENPAYAKLIVAAGGVGNVTQYCQSLLNGPSGTATPEHGKADGHPTGPPSPHPTGHDPKSKASEATR